METLFYFLAIRNCCGFQISADNGVFGQTGPKVGSFDAGYGSTQMVRLIGNVRIETRSKHRSHKARCIICDGY